MKCQLVFHARQENHPFGSGTSYAVGRCETHGMEVSPPFGLDTLCPIGQIEKAIAEGLEKIDARINSRNIAAEEIYNRQRYPDAKPQ